MPYAVGQKVFSSSDVKKCFELFGCVNYESKTRFTNQTRLDKVDIILLLTSSDLVLLLLEQDTPIISIG